MIDSICLGKQTVSHKKMFAFVENPKSSCPIPVSHKKRVRGPGFDTRSGNILSFLLPLFQEGQLSVTGESMCTKYWLTA